MKTKTTFITFFGLLIYHETVSDAQLRVRMYRWAILIIAFLIPALLIPARSRRQKTWILTTSFVFGLIVELIGAALTSPKFEWSLEEIATAPALFIWFGLGQLFNEAIFLVVKKIAPKSSVFQ